MSLGTALNAARSSLSAITERTRTVSENIANLENPDWSRRIAQTVSGFQGVDRVQVTRAQDAEVFRQLLDYTSLHAGNESLKTALDKMANVIGNPDGETSAAALLGQLKRDLNAFAAMPDNAAAAAQVVESARAIVRQLNDGAATVTRIRQEADTEIAKSVERVNDLLRQFHEANAAIVTGRLGDAERTRQEDVRDRVLKELAEEMDIRTIRRADNGIAIYTGGGVVLYERQPREVRFTPSPTLASGATGGQIIIDNVPVTGSGAVMPLQKGRLAALVQVRDDASLKLQRQLDELASGLVRTFAESDPSGASPDAAGLFTWSGAPGLPPAGATVPGLAADIRLNPAADPEAGGNPFTVRDGGMNGAAYVINSTGVAGFPDRIMELAAALETPRAFDPAAGLSASASVEEYATQSISWLQQRRADAQRDADYSSAILSRASQSLSDATGVDLDTELAIMMRLERSYEASARLITAVDRMLATLMNAVR